VVSPYFIPVIIMGVLNVFFVPFGIAGMKSTFSWFDRKFIKPRQGYIAVRQKLPNDRLYDFLVKPTGNLIKFKTYAGEDIQIPFKNEKGWVAFEGNLPVIELDDNNQQKSFVSGEKSGMSQEEITQGFIWSYETGKLLGASDMFGQLKKLLTIIIIVTVLGALVTTFFGFSINNKLKDIPTADSISKTTIEYWFNQTGYPRAYTSTAQENPQPTSSAPKIPLIGG